MVAVPEPAAWGRAYAGVQRPADAEILKLLKAAYADSVRELSKLPAGASQIRRDQALAVKKRILELQAEFFQKTGKVIEARRKQAAARAIDVSARYDAALLALGHREDEARTIADNLAERELNTLDVAIARMTGSATPLSSRVYRAGAFNNGVLERRINSALARGLSAQEFAAEVRQHINPNTPGGTRYAALRLARTEINNAFHAMAIRTAMLKPWVTKVEWHKSKSHPRPDRCDELDGQLFTPADTPKKPHPQCLCYITPVVADSPEADEEFLDQLASGDFDEFLNDFAGRHGLAPVPARGAAPAPVPVLVGFRPGGWSEQTREQILAERRADFAQGWRSSTESDEQFAARVQEMAEAATPAGTVVFTNHTTTLEFLSPVLPATHRRLQRAIEQLQETNPVDPMNIYVRDLKDRALGGQAAPRGGRAISLNALWEDEPQARAGDTWNMPAAQFTDTLVYSLTHEWGHILTHAEEDEIASLLATAPDGDLSDYARSRPDEATAELFAEYFLHSGQPDYSNATADRFALIFGWRRRP